MNPQQHFEDQVARHAGSMSVTLGDDLITAELAVDPQEDVFAPEYGPAMIAIRRALRAAGANLSGMRLETEGPDHSGYAAGSGPGDRPPLRITVTAPRIP